MWQGKNADGENGRIDPFILPIRVLPVLPGACLLEMGQLAKADERERAPWIQTQGRDPLSSLTCTAVSPGEPGPPVTRIRGLYAPIWLDFVGQKRQ